MGYKIKHIYQGENLVRPNSIVCDFTQSDYGFTFYGRTSTTVTYGRNSNGLYMNISTGAQEGAAWKIPSSITTKGNPKKVEITFKGTGYQPGVGLCYGIDTKIIRHYQALRIKWGSQNNSLSQYLSENTEYTFIIDFQNKVILSTLNSSTLALTDNAVSTFYDDWNSGNVNIGLYTSTASYTYIEKIKFYF